MPNLAEFQVKYWSKKFKWGTESMEGDLRPGSPVEVTTPEMCQDI